MSYQECYINDSSIRKWKALDKWDEIPEKGKRGFKSPDRADTYVLTFGEFLIEAPEYIVFPSIASVVMKRLIGILKASLNLTLLVIL
ncbi:phage terminase small subunit-related protein [Paenibacillus polymyxa]|uniref:phage terminase small subunit-related protein n=1 Tax=Paenibacillus polymyxa TaxID=1406 RepID=UPI0007EBBED0|nr:phage terminase small subunit-related protein [Paenibacillus polymyxa]OAZ49756.1 hypothetical protein A9Z39_10495 [Paenibacillus polymyxa]